VTVCVCMCATHQIGDRMAMAVAAPQEVDDNAFSFQEETLTAADLQVFGGPPKQEHHFGLRSGWKSERAPDNEIRERLLALATPVIAVHSDGSSPPQSPSSRPPDPGAQHYKFADKHSRSAPDKSYRLVKDRPALEDRPGNFNLVDSCVDSWSNLIAQPMAVHHRSKADGSWDINEAEQLLAMSPAAAKHHVHMPLGLVVMCPSPKTRCA